MWFTWHKVRALTGWLENCSTRVEAVAASTERSCSCVHALQTCLRHWRWGRVLLARRYELLGRRVEAQVDSLAILAILCLELLPIRSLMHGPLKRECDCGRSGLRARHRRRWHCWRSLWRPAWWWLDDCWSGLATWLEWLRIKCLHRLVLRNKRRWGSLIHMLVLVLTDITRSAWIAIRRHLMLWRWHGLELTTRRHGHSRTTSHRHVHL